MIMILPSGVPTHPGVTRYSCETELVNNALRSSLCATAAYKG